MVVPETGGQKTAHLATKSEDLIHQGGALVHEYSIASREEYCARCQTLDLEKMFDDSPLSTTSDGSPEPKKIMCIGRLDADDENSACPVCRFFALSRLGYTPSGIYDVWKLSWHYNITKYVRASAEHSRPRHVLVVASDANCVEQFALSTGYPKHKGFLTPLEPARHGHEISPRRRLDYVDFSLVRSWISDCNDHHGCCGQLVAFDAVTVPIQAMDCDTAELHTISRDTKYAALSYVWGKETTQSQNESSTSSPRGLPWLIEDAMTAAKSLGIQYLWVDRYCISKSDPFLRYDSIKQMDLIYGRAEITLIGLGADPTFRLPGVSTRRTTSQPSLTIGGREILSTMGPPCNAIQESKWWTRAWTFQEATLSRRRLYFTHDQVYFECRLMHHCETIVSWHTPREIVSGANHGPWGSMVTTLDLGFCLANLKDLITLYFDRDLTYMTDRIDAFEGVFQVFARRSFIRHFFGLPLDRRYMRRSFTNSLLWTAQSPAREPQFPSWSWTGWRGKILKWPENWGQGVLKICTAQVWIQGGWDGSLDMLEDSGKDGELNRPPACPRGFDLPVQLKVPTICISAPAAQLKFVSPRGGGLVLSPRECGRDWGSAAPVVTWGSCSEDERCYVSIDEDRLPGLPELEAYRLFMVLQMGIASSSSALLIVGERDDGNKERVGVVRLRNGGELYPGAEWRIRQKYGLSRDTELGSGGQVVWTEQWVPLG